MLKELGDPTKRAVTYVRMSIEKQNRSLQHQHLAIDDYALRNDMMIVRTYSDIGKRGRRLEGRSSLQKLLADVSSGQAGLFYILVYDISRWGRFQNAESHYK